MVTVVKQIGNSKITFYSPSGVITLSPEERGQWFTRELEAGNPVVCAIADRVQDIELKALERNP